MPVRKRKVIKPNTDKILSHFSSVDDFRARVIVPYSAKTMEMRERSPVDKATLRDVVQYLRERKGQLNAEDAEINERVIARFQRRLVSVDSRLAKRARVAERLNIYALEKEAMGLPENELREAYSARVHNVRVLVLDLYADNPEVLKYLEAKEPTPRQREIAREMSFTIRNLVKVAHEATVLKRVLKKRGINNNWPDLMR